MNRINEFEKTYTQALETIEYYLFQQPAMSKLVQWMLTTDVNAHFWLPHELVTRLSSAQGFVAIVQTISHAVQDDGDITFVRVNGMPRIVFYYSGKANFEEHALTVHERCVGNNVVEVLDILPEEFGPLVELANINRLKQCFVNDAVMLGEKFAVARAIEHACFDRSWLVELADDIAAAQLRDGRSSCN